MANKEQMVLDRLHIMRKAAREIHKLAPCVGVDCKDCPVEKASSRANCGAVLEVAEMELPGDDPDAAY